MSATSLTLFLLIVAVASYLQALTGFALGIFAMGGVIALEVSSLPTAAMVINVMMICNVVLALRSSWRFIAGRLFFYTMAGVIPGTIIGLWVLDHLTGSHFYILQGVLGVLIMGAGATLFMRPIPLDVQSPSTSFARIGVLGGIFGGLYSIPGPPVVYHFYRQPIKIESLRATLLAVFGVMSLFRFSFVALQGGLTDEVVQLAGLSVPIVIIVTLLYLRFPPNFSEVVVRRSAFVLLTLTGLFIIGTSLLPSNFR